ncbi:hypothetical protein BDR04DRAFT_1116736 [Suillus decipiens]|nr:hypothetical protein BDR04DRAFT_1116736 [Suillus decipiens]
MLVQTKCPKEEIAAEKKKQEEKEAKSAAAKQVHIRAAMQEDVMAIKQQAQLVGPPKLNLQLIQEMHNQRALLQTGKSPILVFIHLGARHMLEALQSVKQPEGIIKNWADKVAKSAKKSQAQLDKPSAPPSIRTTVTDDIDVKLELDDALKEYEPRRGGVGKVKTQEHAKGEKHAFSVIKDSEVEEAGDPNDFMDKEALEMLDDTDADVNGDDGKDQINDSDSDVEIEVAVRSTTFMSVDISDKQTITKHIKTKCTDKAVSINLRKLKPNNDHIPEDIIKSWRAKFLPALMYWVINSSYGWTIPEEDLCNALYEISDCIGGKNCVLHEFDVGTYGYDLAVQKIHEWKALFSSTAITVLMAFFTADPEYEMQAVRKAFTDDQLDDLRFVYKNPENDDNPGAFLSEYFLCIFATHLNAIAGHEKVDTLDCGIMGLETALALTAAAGECMLALVSSNYLVPCDPSGSKKNHKIELAFNESTNWMSHTGTAFSAGNWEMDTKAYMETVMELPERRIKEIIVWVTPFMKRICRSGTSIELSESEFVVILSFHAPSISIIHTLLQVHYISTGSSFD